VRANPREIDLQYLERATCRGIGGWQRYYLTAGFVKDLSENLGPNDHDYATIRSGVIQLERHIVAARKSIMWKVANFLNSTIFSSLVRPRDTVEPLNF